MATTTLKRGTSSTDVAEVRRLLEAKGYGTNSSPADPYAFDDELDAAVRKFQGSMGLATDGIVGVGTWGALRGVNVTVSPTSNIMVPVAPAPVVASGPPMALIAGGVALVLVALFMMNKESSGARSSRRTSSRRTSRKSRR